MEVNKIYCGDALQVLSTIPDESVNCCVTSPPYWALRDYGVHGQIGQESTPDEYVMKMVKGFREVKRVLKNDGTLWLNLGDSYASSGRDISALKQKDLVGIPWMVAFALRADGWYLRQDIIWSKPNPMPESVTDRCTKSHEYIFLLSKSPKYYYDADAIKTPGKNPKDDIRRISKATLNGKSTPNSLKNGIRRTDKQRGHSRSHAGFNDRWDQMSKEEQQSMGANKRSVWEVATMPFKEAHYATFPPNLIVDCIKAGCPENGIVLDPFMGAGTTALVARKLGRNFIGIELNPDNVKMANERLERELGMFM